MTEGDWVSTNDAVKRLTNQSDNPRALLLNLLRAGSASARAAAVKRDGDLVEQAPFLKRKSKELKAGFWEAVSHEDWSAGMFAFMGSAPSELFEGGEALHWVATEVEINWVEVLRQVGPLTNAIEKTRAPSVKSARPPTDNEILAMADKMKACGLNGRIIAKEMRLKPGFENVANETVRGLIKGRYLQGRPKKAP